MSEHKPLRLTLGISGASGLIYARKMLLLLSQIDGESEVIVSRAALEVARCEEQLDSIEDEKQLIEHLLGVEGLTATAIPGRQRQLQVGRQRLHICDNHSFGSAPASGSAPSNGMVIAPCSMKSLAAIASGYSETLLHRAADVALKERRRLVLVTREAPLSEIHIENMLRATRAGAILFPASPPFYQRADSIDELVTILAARVLTLFGAEFPDQLTAWGSSSTGDSGT